MIVQVEGRGDSDGQLVADKIRFERIRHARLNHDGYARRPLRKRNQERIAGQIDELYAVAAEARSEAANANERISALDDYDLQASTAVTFKVNSAVLSPEAKDLSLDEFWQRRPQNAKAFMIEVAGHTDSTGGEAKNFRLSQERAESVGAYLAVAHKISLRRFVTPMGYGKTEAVADNTTAAGRAQNRRVEVRCCLIEGCRNNRARLQPQNPSLGTGSARSKRRS